MAFFPSGTDQLEFVAYEMEKVQGNTNNAANIFAELYCAFPNDEAVWSEVSAIIKAFRERSPTDDQVAFKKMFDKFSPSVKRKLLFAAAERSDTVLEHCRLMLELFSLFPEETVSKYGMRLFETLQKAEESENKKQDPINIYRKMLVCDLLPLLVEKCLDEETNLKFLKVAFEFYASFLIQKESRIKDLRDKDCSISPLKNMYDIFNQLAKNLNWVLGDIFVSHSKSQLDAPEEIWTEIGKYYISYSHEMEKKEHLKHLVYAVSILLITCLNEYHDWQAYAVLIELPIDIQGSVDSASTIRQTNSPAVQDKKEDEDENAELTAYNEKFPIKEFFYGCKCWLLITSNPVVNEEFNKITDSLGLEKWITPFISDMCLYKGFFTKYFENELTVTNPFKKHLQEISVYYTTKKYMKMYEIICEAVTLLMQQEQQNSLSGPEYNCDTLLIQQSDKRSLHYLHLIKGHILQYIVKILLMAIRTCTRMRPPKDGIADGHMLVLVQFDWPSEYYVYKTIIKKIETQKKFSYSYFMKYMINSQILERFMRIGTETNVTLDITGPSQSTYPRRMSTRGVDKGAKSDFKMNMKRQMLRYDDNLPHIIMRFITTEKKSISDCLKI